MENRGVGLTNRWKSAVFLAEDLQFGWMNAVRIMSVLIGSFVWSSCVVVIKAHSSFARSPRPALLGLNCAMFHGTHAQLGAHFQQPSVVVNEILLTFWHGSACGIETDLHSECPSVLDSLVNLALVWIVELFQVFFLSFGCASWGERYDKNI